MDANTLSATAGILLSLIFAYVPGVSKWFEALDGLYKRLVMAGALVLVSAGSVALSCWGIVPGVSCDQAGVIELVKAFISALVANQATFVIEPKKPTT